MLAGLGLPDADGGGSTDTPAGADLPGATLACARVYALYPYGLWLQLVCISRNSN